MKTGTCEMKGFLSLLILWLLSKKNMTGVEIAKELGKRKGSQPSPGTIYPALKDLKEKELISSDKEKQYSLTKKGKIELDHGLKVFCTAFADFQEMKNCCSRSN